MTTKKKLARALLLFALFGIAVFVLKSSKPEGIVFTHVPSVKAVWEISTSSDIHIGDVINATLRITTEPGVVVNLNELPSVGDVWMLPAKYKESSSTFGSSSYSIPEGNVEVVSRIVKQSQDQGVVIEIAYGFVYLLPVDSPKDDKTLPWDVPIYEEYRFLTGPGSIENRKEKIVAASAGFDIVSRVDKTSQPIFKMFDVVEPSTSWPTVRLIGIGLVGLAACLVVWRLIRVVRKAARSKDGQIQAYQAIQDLYDQWQKSHNHEMFLEAIKLYRRPFWEHMSVRGFKLWAATTFVLYGGVPLDSEQESSIFSQVMKEVSHEHPA